MEGKFESLDQNVVGARIRWWRRLNVAIRGLGSPKAKALQPKIQGYGVFTAAGWGGIDVPEHGVVGGI